MTYDPAARTHGDSRDDLTFMPDRGEVRETPLEVLRAHRLTPQALAFIRNSNPYPDGADTLAPAPLSGKLEIGGLVARPLTLDLAELTDFPRVEVEAVMQCAGNGRAFYRNAREIDGAPWARGGVMNGVWGGARVADVLARAGIAPGGRFLTATGGDGADSEDGPYEKSVPLADGLARGLLAHTLNGEPLSGAHGGPLRLMMPGYYGTVNVKWLRRLTLTHEETAHEAQRERYRVPAPGGSKPCWRQPVKSLIWSPLEGERTSEQVTISGMACNDGAAPITQVGVTLDGGRTWQEAELEPEYGSFAWRRWHLRLALPPGEHEVWSRATDALGRTQPLDGDDTWNPDGYEWHGVDKLKFEVG